MKPVFDVSSRGRTCSCAFIAFIFAAVILSDVATGQESCQPDCKGGNTFVPDPLDCARYYVYLSDGGPADAPLPCASGEEFDAEKGKCVTADPANPCTALCPEPKCSFKCNLGSLGVDLVRDPYDCGHYHVCTTEGTLGPFTCQADAPYFNGDICVQNKEVCCTQGCRPYCEPGEDLAADPLNCNKYYNCSAGDLSTSVPMTCPEGSTFDPAMGECVAGRPCRDCGGGAVAASTTAPPPDATTPAPSTPVDTTKAPPTTTTPTDATTTAPVQCLVPDVCLTTGNFPICNICQRKYYFCSDAGAEPLVLDCINDLVFNPEPSYPYCMLKENCPYVPSA